MSLLLSHIQVSAFLNIVTNPPKKKFWEVICRCPLAGMLSQFCFSLIFTMKKVVSFLFLPNS